MKKKIFYFTAIISLATVITSCGGETNDETENNENVEEVEAVEEDKFEDFCKDGNDIFFQVEGYDYSMTEPLEYNDKFEVARSEWTMKNDSTAELKMYNYELGAEETATDFQIYVEFHAKNGEVIQNGVYPYMDYDSNLWSKVNIITPQGKVWFNWSAGMPDQGTVKLNFSSDEQACGSFSMEVNNPDNSTIGHVVLNGSWTVE